MPMDIRINEVQTEVDVVDPRALLSPAVLEEVVRAVLARLADEQRANQQRRADQSLGSQREQGA